MTEQISAVTASRKKASKRFYYVFLAVLLVPAAGIPLASDLGRVWVFVLMLNTTMFFFNLWRVQRQPGNAASRTDAVLALAAAVLFAAISASWGALLALDVYKSVSLGA